MDEKTQNRLFTACVIIILGLGLWLGLLYRNGGNTADALELSQSELDNAIDRNTSLAKELVDANGTVDRLEDEQRESNNYQRELADELVRSKELIGQLESTTANVSESIGRIDNLTREYADLIAEGERFIADGKE